MVAIVLGTFTATESQSMPTLHSLREQASIVERSRSICACMLTCKCAPRCRHCWVASRAPSVAAGAPRRATGHLSHAKLCFALVVACLNDDDVLKQTSSHSTTPAYVRRHDSFLALLPIVSQRTWPRSPRACGFSITASFTGDLPPDDRTQGETQQLRAWRPRPRGSEVASECCAQL